MKVLVIGANGRLGRACVEVLPSKGHDVTAFVRSKSTFPLELQTKCASVLEGDATSQTQLEEAIRASSCDAIIEVGGYTPFWGTNCNLAAIYKATFEAAETVAKERSGSIVIKPPERMRVWVINDIAMMDSPYGDDGPLKQYLPDVFPIHRITYPLVWATSTEAVAWSMMCPGEMQPKDHKVAGKAVGFGGPKVPHWNPVGLWIPILGRYINAFVNAMWYVQTTYERVAGFIADDLKCGSESDLIGKKIAPHQTP